MIGTIIFSIIFLSIGIGLFIWGVISFRRKRLIENIPTSKIRSIAMGLVEIYGEVVAKKDCVLKSPFFQKPCVYYKYKIEEYRSSGKNSHWATIKKGEESQLFYLKDETGQVLVNPKDAKIELSKDGFFRSSLGNDPLESAKPFLESVGVKYEGFFGINKTMRYSEWHIATGDKIYIIGNATDNPYVEEASVKKGVEDVMIKKGNHEKFYYISDKKESGVLRSFAGKAFFGLILGSIFIIIGLIFLVL